MARRNPVRDTAVVELIDRLRAEEFDTHADHLQRTLDRGARIVALDEADRHAILRVLEECPDELQASGNAHPGSSVASGRGALGAKISPR